LAKHMFKHKITMKPNQLTAAAAAAAAVFCE
jgi:hypothetical protein